MPQFTEPKKAAPPKSGAPPASADPPLLVHPLTESHGEGEVLAFLAERPVQTVVMGSLIRDNGLESPFNRGTFYACRDQGGRLEGVALIGHATFVEARTEAALAAFAELAQKEADAHMILGEQALVRRFWDYYAPAGQAARSFCRELLFELRWPLAACEPARGLRRATLDDLALVMPVHAAMACEQSGVNPLEADPHGFRLRCARRVEHGRVWVLVEGVYVEPASRQQGHGLRCLSQLGWELLRRSAAVSALVNEQNLVAQALFMKAGYKLRGYWDTIFLERRGAGEG